MGAALILAIAFVVSYNHTNQLLATLTGMTAGLFAVQVANIHVFTLVVTLWWMTAPRGGPRRTPWLILGCTIPVALTALTGDLVNNPLLGVQILALGTGGAMVAARGTSDSERRMLRGLLITCTVASLLGLAQVAGILPAELVHQDVSGLGRPSGFYPEPDWLGLFSALGFVLAWRTTTGPVRLGLVLANGATCAVAFARAPWVALAVALVIYALIRAFTMRRQAKRSGAIGPVLLLATLGLVAFAALPDLRADLTARASTMFGDVQTTDVSGKARIQQVNGLRALIETAPWYGHGVSSSGRIGVSGVYDPNSSNSVGSNWILALLADAKFLALPLIGLFGVTAIRRGMTVPGQLLVVLLVNNLFSNATIQPVTWMMLGLAQLAPTALGRDVGPQDEGRAAGLDHHDHVAG